MKKLKTFIVVLSLVCVNALMAQEVPQPDFANKPCYYIEGTSVVKNFAKENVAMAGKVGKAVLEVDGLASPIRIKASETYALIIKAGDADPSNAIFFYKMDIGKKKRSCIMASQSVMGDKTEMGKHRLSFTLEKIADKVYKIVPTQKLEVGEYMFFMGTEGLTFGIE